jgi:two-component system alkaline phosphatase synthesis response regulator PhoP
MLTARSEEADRVSGLRIGADDYLTKPFSPTRVGRTNRSHPASQPRQRRQRRPTTSPSALRVLPDRMEAFIGDNQLDLTTTEFTLLMELALHAGRVLTRDQIIDRVWGNDFYGTDRIVDVYIGQVRRKIEQAGGDNLIQTMRGIGYKLVDESR